MWPSRTACTPPGAAVWASPSCLRRSPGLEPRKAAPWPKWRLLGGTPLIELYLMYGQLDAFLQANGIIIARSLVGSYITSLEMAGCSFTLLRLDDELERLWDAPVRTAALQWSRRG